jgi:hypothetical protein
MRRKPDPANLSVRVLHRMAKTLKKGRRITLHADGFTLATGEWTTRVSAEPHPDESADVFAGIIRIESPVQIPEDAESVDEVLALANSLTTIGAAVRDTEDEVRVVSAVPIARESELESLEQHSQLILGATLIQQASFRQALGIMFGVEDDSPLTPEAAAPSRWTADDFREAARQVGDDLELHLDGASLGFSVPLNGKHVAHGAINTAPHRAFGNGLRYGIVLPIAAPAAQAAELCRVYNLREFAIGCGAPLLGAWAIGPRGTVVHTGFIPNMLYDPTLIAGIPYWMAIRAAWASGFLEID